RPVARTPRARVPLAFVPKDADVALRVPDEDVEVAPAGKGRRRRAVGDGRGFRVKPDVVPGVDSGDGSFGASARLHLAAPPFPLAATLEVSGWLRERVVAGRVATTVLLVRVFGEIAGAACQNLDGKLYCPNLLHIKLRRDVWNSPDRITNIH